MSKSPKKKKRTDASPKGDALSPSRLITIKCYQCGNEFETILPIEIKDDELCWDCGFYGP